MRSRKARCKRSSNNVMPARVCKYSSCSGTSLNQCCSSSRNASIARKVPASLSLSFIVSLPIASLTHPSKPIDRPVFRSNTGIPAWTRAAFTSISKLCWRWSST